MVSVYRLVTRHTLEEKIMSLQAFKRHVAGSVVNQQNAHGFTALMLVGCVDCDSLRDQMLRMDLPGVSRQEKAALATEKMLDAVQGMVGGATGAP